MSNGNLSNSPPNFQQNLFPRKNTMIRKFGLARYRQMFERLKAAGGKCGCEFNMGGTIGNSFQSHRLIEWSKKFGLEKHNEVMEQIFIAYFKDNKDISDTAVLVECATAAGVEGAAEFLAGSDHIDEVKRKLRPRGINGVPFFIVNDSIRFSGAHPPEVFLALFEELDLPLLEAK
eukprot:TRINITY_DN4973_c0_g1_i1.p1 TRINITY_DN4973_c0_g1~~TRINITY_DN4973_c0_g1_i1.p1  ORF type:complete len:175 (-),score=36.36 TRINITY_DN4973_c0_g1_i1:332-856(-)